ncbi:MAG: RNA polymerase sigma factor RpoH [Gammaproteobacteria bacterium]|nr:RNA polymerase sigma factor RpoH [Gammaproteobacteria bacterium]
MIYNGFLFWHSRKKSAKLLILNNNWWHVKKEPLKNDFTPKALAIAPTMGSIEAYVSWVNQIPMLTASEELELATKFHHDGDLEAARQLVLSHLRFVAHVAKNYLGYGLPKADLIQEGTIGLMKAVKRFDPDMGVRLVSFAVHWIKAEIHEFVLRNWRIVKIATTKSQRKLFFNLRRATKKLNWFSNEEVLNIARELKVDPKDVRTMEARLYNSDVAFDGYGDDDSMCEGGYFDPARYLTADTRDPIDEIADIELGGMKTANLAVGLSKLDQRSREILECRWLKENKATLHELAAKYSISAERVRQIEESAIKKLKKEFVT